MNGIPFVHVGAIPDEFCVDDLIGDQTVTSTALVQPVQPRKRQFSVLEVTQDRYPERTDEEREDDRADRLRKRKLPRLARLPKHTDSSTDSDQNASDETPGESSPQHTTLSATATATLDCADDRWRMQLDAFVHARANNSTPKSVTSWMGRQRRAYETNNLPPHRLEALRQARFPWNDTEGSSRDMFCWSHIRLTHILDAQWKRRLLELDDFRKEYGHANVPQKWQSLPELGRWVARQRDHHRSGKLNSERSALLDGIGFVWNTKKQSTSGVSSWSSCEVGWDTRLWQLQQFHREKGHARVTPRDDPDLALWVDRQRTKLRDRSMSEKHAVRLRLLGL